MENSVELSIKLNSFIKEVGLKDIAYVIENIFERSDYIYQTGEYIESFGLSDKEIEEYFDYEEDDNVPRAEDLETIDRFTKESNEDTFGKLVEMLNRRNSLDMFFENIFVDQLWLSWNGLDYMVETENMNEEQRKLCMTVINRILNIFGESEVDEYTD